MKTARIKHFLHIGIWRPGGDGMPRARRLLLAALRRVYLAVRFFIERGHVDFATQLAFSTILAIVPIFAVIIAVARGFGLSTYIERWLHSLLASQPQAADTISQLVDAYLAHAQTGLFIGIGLLFMLYSVLSLIYNVEHVFDSIWQVKEKRSAVRIITDYTAMLFLVPICLIVMSGLAILGYNTVSLLQAYPFLGTLSGLAIKVTPLLMMSIIFTALFVMMPNTKVRLRHALIPGVLAAVTMLAFQYLYIHCQLFLTGYNAIYGSLAALPLFMLWMLISWYITLFFAELCYTNQNMEYFTFLITAQDLSQEARIEISAVLLSHICRQFSRPGSKPYSAIELKQLTGLPIRVVSELLYNLRAARLLTERADAETDEVTYLPAFDIAGMTMGRMVQMLDSYVADRHKERAVRPRQLMDEAMRKRILEIREDYLKALSNIALAPRMDVSETEERASKAGHVAPVASHIAPDTTPVIPEA